MIVKIIIISVIVLILLSVIKGGIELLGQIIITVFTLGKRFLGLFIFLFLIVSLYYHGTDLKNQIRSGMSADELESYRGHFEHSMIIIDCENEFSTVKTLDNGKIYTQEEKMGKTVFIDVLNEYSRIVLINPKSDEFEVDTFMIGEIKFVDNHHYIDYKRDGQTFEYR
jgi:hypothetical protein